MSLLKSVNVRFCINNHRNLRFFENENKFYLHMTALYRPTIIGSLRNLTINFVASILVYG